MSRKVVRSETAFPDQAEYKNNPAPNQELRRLFNPLFSWQEIESVSHPVHAFWLFHARLQ